MTPTFITFIGAKGGCGATLLAANLAAGAVRESRAREGTVCLADFDFYKGDVAGALDLWPTRTMHDLMIDPTRLDVDVVRGMVTPHASGLRVLPQPHDLSRVLQVGIGEVTRLVATLRDAFGLTIADAGSRLDEIAAATALRADITVLVTTPEVAGLRDAGRALDMLRGLGVGASQLRLVVNRWPGAGDSTVEEVAALLDLPVTATFPVDTRTCLACDHAGSLLRDAAPHSALARAVEEARGRILGVEAPAIAARPWSLRRLIGREAS